MAVSNDQLLALIASMNPELAPMLALLQANDVEEEKPKRKPSPYNRRYAAAYRRIRKKNTLKNGSMRKGYGGKRGHNKIVKMAHAEAKKGGRKK